jgi:hypothetical protein
MSGMKLNCTITSLRHQREKKMQIKKAGKQRFAWFAATRVPRRNTIIADTIDI